MREIKRISAFEFLSVRTQLEKMGYTITDIRYIGSEVQFMVSGEEKQTSAQNVSSLQDTTLMDKLKAWINH